jgi:GDP-L-fucose synthase
MEKNFKIYVAGHKGLVGSAIVRALERQGYGNIVTRTHKELDLTNSKSVSDFFTKERPVYVIDAAAKVGGIMANKTYPADFIYQNLAIQQNIIHQSYLHKVKKLLFLGSVCIYPKFAQQPIKEEYLMTGELEPTNQAYAIAKISGISMAQSYNAQYGTDFISAMPTNLYGVNDNFNPETSHVIPALIRKFHQAKLDNSAAVTLWGTGSVYREFLHADDAAEACIFLMNHHSGSQIINVGAGKEISIKALAELIQKIVGYKGAILWDTSKPDGTPRRLLDISRLTQMGWSPTIDLENGLRDTYKWFMENCY